MAQELLQWIKSEFPLDVLDAGKALHEQGLSQLNGEIDSTVHAHFALEHPVDSWVARESATQIVHLRCSCSVFSQGEPCRHLWATLLGLPEQSQGLVAGSESYQSWIADFQFIDFQEQERAIAPAIPSGTWKEMLDFVAPEQQGPKNPEPKGKSGAKIPLRRRGPLPVAMKRGLYAIDLRLSLEKERLVLRFFSQDMQPSGELAGPRSILLSHSVVNQFPDEIDKKIIWSLLGKTLAETELGSFVSASAATSVLLPEFADEILSLLHESGRLRLLDNRLTAARGGAGDIMPLPLQDETWFLQLHLRSVGGSFFLQANLGNGQSRRRLQEALGVFDSYVLFSNELVRARLNEHQRWYDLFLKRRDIEVPPAELDDFLKSYYKSPSAPTLVLPDELEFTDLAPLTPSVRMIFTAVDGSPLLQSRLEFEYSGLVTTTENHASFVYDLEQRQRRPRDQQFEADVKAKFASLSPLRANTTRLRKMAADGFFEPRRFLAAAEAGLGWGWEVLAHQKSVRKHQDFQTTVSSNMDWFDLKAQVEFAGVRVPFPELLSNIRSGERLIKLSTGEYGILPAEWLERMRPWAEIGTATVDGLRLSKVQALFLASSWATDDERFTGDQKFRQLTDILRDLQKISPRSPGADFSGELRPYQKEGLAWLDLITQHEIGGILADDMGLGKTIQVLALLCELKHKPKQPHLIVAPKSLIFNWINEAHKFAPSMKVMDYTGPGRHALQDQIEEVDVVLTTYQTLRSDIERMRTRRFDFLVLDEAQFIKNPESQAAMACRLIQADKRVALSGTPIENSLSDLFSILSVVTPGLLSDSQVRRWSRVTGAESRESIQSLARALRPFILRRSKSQVLQDLPEKTEQILLCELSVDERKKYDELRQYYWASLSEKIQAGGLGRSRMEVLEALLRLRQASCHQGLLDETLRGRSSTKFELLLSQIEQLIADGHKALVFSQFTSLLDLLRQELHKKGIRYEYLDGQTQHRQERVESFQNNADIPLFLLSLKAGGVGLNLTAADYVFILDPWWNPATEAQAIDRTHRIGQTKKVFAYKLIAKDTVEEKIVALQQRKRELANQVISDENGVFKNLTMEDLRELFL